MSYIGSTPTTQSFIAGTDYFNGTGSAVSFTMSRAVNSVNDIEVIVNNVEQIPSGYSVSGTTLTFSAAPSAGTSNVYVRYLSTTNLSLAIPAGTSASFNTVTATSLTATTLAATNLSYSGTLTGAAATFSGIVAANGGGIQFPATQVTSADANTLDDYEEGTWTPVLTPATGTITSQSCFGSYVKIGKQVTITFKAVITGGTVTAVSTIGGFPFASANANQQACGAARETQVAGEIWQIAVVSNTSTALMYRYNNSTAVTSSYGWQGSVTYFTD